jgi:protein SOK2
MATMDMQGGYGQQEVARDTTGQVAPPGVKPRVTATLWEDEGTLCFQVDVKGTCVARREGRPALISKCKGNLLRLLI